MPVETKRIRGYFSTSKKLSFFRWSSRIELSVFTVEASMLTSKRHLPGSWGYQEMVPSNPLKEPLVLMPKFLITNPISEPSSAGLYCCARQDPAAERSSSNPKRNFIIVGYVFAIFLHPGNKFPDGCRKGSL